MISPVREINFSEVTESVPAFLAIVMMPLAYSIAEGIVWGLASYVILKVLFGKGKEISIATYIVAAVLIVSFFL
jgi:AGZA family xanthine/uracil permease-like MFS transporter